MQQTEKSASLRHLERRAKPLAERLAVPASCESRLESPYDRRQRERAESAQREAGQVLESVEYEAAISHLEGDGVEECEDALLYLSMLDPDTIALHGAAVAAKLDHPSNAVRLRALLVFERLKTEALQKYVEVVAAKLHDSETHIRDSAAKVLRKLGTEELLDRLASLPATLASVFSVRSPLEVNVAVEHAKSRGDYALVRMLINYVRHDEFPFHLKAS